MLAPLTFHGKSQAQTLPWEIWDEKWPISYPVTPENSLVTYLHSNFGKLGELAANRLKNILADPQSQYKISKKALEYLQTLYANATLTEDDKARQFVAAIEADIASFSTLPGGTLGLSAGFSGTYSVFRLNWDRQTQRLQCQRASCSCPDGTHPPPGGYCYGWQTIGGNTYPYSYPASCAYNTDTVDLEASYKIYRNGKLLVTYGEQRSGANGSLNFSAGFLTGSVTWTNPPANTATRAGPFFDYDPYSSVIGTPLTYRVVAESGGCGNGYTNNYTGFYTKDTTITVDSDGDSRPDFYPLAELNKKRGRIPLDPFTILLLLDD